MNKKILDKLNSSEYNFLREKDELKGKILYLVLSGSYGYGTNTENSDIDLRGFSIEGEDVLFKLGSFEQFEHIESDTVIYGLKKFVNLALNANPNALELLGVEEECIYMMSSGGRKIRENAELFLSKRVVNSFGNYALAQLRRLQNALAHDSYDLALKEQHILNTLNKQIVDFNKSFTSFENGSINLYIGEKPKKEIYMDINLKAYPLRDFTAIYSNMTNTIKSYEKLTHKNNKKDEKKLYKHAMHLIRLLLTGKYILQGKGIITKLDSDLPLLLNIRNGKYTFQEIFEMVNNHEKEFKYASKETTLKDQPERAQVEELMYEIYKEFYIGRKSAK